MFISSQSNWSIKSKKIVDKSFKAHQPKLAYGRKSQNYAVIWSQMFILSKSKLSVKSKKYFDKSFKAQQPKWGYKRKSKNYAFQAEQLAMNLLIA